MLHWFSLFILHNIYCECLLNTIFQRLLECFKAECTYFFCTCLFIRPGPFQWLRGCPIPFHLSWLTQAGGYMCLHETTVWSCSFLVFMYFSFQINRDISGSQPETDVHHPATSQASEHHELAPRARQPARAELSPGLWLQQCGHLRAQPENCAR